MYYKVLVKQSIALYMLRDHSAEHANCSVLYISVLYYIEILNKSNITGPSPHFYTRMECMAYQIPMRIMIDQDLSLLSMHVFIFHMPFKCIVTIQSFLMGI